MEQRNATVAVIGAGDYIGTEIAKKFAAEGFTVFAGRRDGAKLEPLVRDIEAAAPYPERDVRRLLKLAGRLGWADEVAHDHFFLRPTVHEMTTIVADLAAHGEDGVFTAAQFRDRVDNGRKVAIQILEFFDRHGVTLNRDDLRRVNPHRLDLFAPRVHASNEDNGRESSLVGRSDFKSG